MPSLIVLGRRWNISSDDFVIPAITEAFIRIIWLTVTIVGISLGNPFQCISYKFFVNMVLLVSLNLTAIIFCVVISHISSKGGILQPIARCHIPALLYIRLPIYLIELLCTVFSTANAFVDTEQCHLGILLRLTILLQWFLLIAVLIGVAVVFNPSGRKLGNHYVQRLHDISFFKCIKWLSMCFERRGEQTIRSALKDISNMSASFFYDIDLVPSDILAGLIILMHTPKDSVSYLKTVTVDTSSIPSWMSIENAKEMLSLSVAIYGWRTYLLKRFSLVALWRLLRSSRCLGRNSNKESVVDDNCCSCNYAAFTLTSNCRYQIRYLSFRNHLYESPFAVVVDTISRNVIIAIRGSASITDIITDLSLDDEAITTDLRPSNSSQANSSSSNDCEIRVHTGMLRSARYILTVLRKRRIFEELDEIVPGYITITCGHSLGAGIAAILSILLKPEREVRCFAFSPPGCTVNQCGLDESKNYIFGIVLGDDIVPRLSFQTLNDLKLRIIDSLITCETPKYKILIRGCYKLFFNTISCLESDAESGPRNSEVNDRLSLVYNRPPLSSEYGGTDNLERLQRHNRIELFAPGQLLHLTVVGERRVEGWIDLSELAEVKLSSTMLSDHWPFYLQKVLSMEESVNSSIL